MIVPDLMSLADLPPGPVDGPRTTADHVTPGLYPPRPALSPDQMAKLALERNLTIIHLDDLKK